MVFKLLVFKLEVGVEAEGEPVELLDGAAAEQGEAEDPLEGGRDLSDQAVEGHHVVLSDKNPVSW